MVLNYILVGCPWTSFYDNIDEPSGPVLLHSPYSCRYLLLDSCSGFVLTHSRKLAWWVGMLASLAKLHGEDRSITWLFTWIGKTRRVLNENRALKRKCFAPNPPHDAAKQPDNLSTVNSQCLVNKFTCKFVRRKLCRQHERPSPWPALWEALIRCNLEIPQREIQSIADQSLEAIYQLKVVLPKTCVLHLW